MTKAITVSGLHKSFGRTPALDGLDLDVDSGEIHGFLGPNGAGKSTTIRVLLGPLRATPAPPRCSAATGARRTDRRIADVPATSLAQPLGEVIDLGLVARRPRHPAAGGSSGCPTKRPPRGAGPRRRLRWAAGHLAVAFGGTVLIMLLAGLGLALGHGRDTGPLLGACLAQVPAVWVIGGVAVLLHGLLPRAAVAAWAVAGAVLLIGWVGPVLDVPRAVLDLSPFGAPAEAAGRGDGVDTGAGPHRLGGGTGHGGTGGAAAAGPAERLRPV
ncbi:hypothetical protein SGLAM104S_05702 [Streptomyces glaucescens]